MHKTTSEVNYPESRIKIVGKCNLTEMFVFALIVSSLLSTSFFAVVMSEMHFRLLQKFLHFVDNRQKDESQAIHAGHLERFDANINKKKFWQTMFQRKTY